MEAIEKRETVLNRFYEEERYNDIFIEEGESHGEHYIIFGCDEDAEAFIKYAQEVLKEKFDSAWELEKALKSNFVFADEWSKCYCCGKVIRTSPDSYFWMPEFFFSGSDGCICKDCFNDSDYYKEEYLEKLIDSYENANYLFTSEQLEALGFVKIDEEFQDGFYNRHDNPEKILKALKKEYGDNIEVIFSINDVGQFHINFNAWIRKMEEEF